MHKPLKGAIALGAAGRLLLGGAGTYALWNDSVELDGGTVNAGQLEFVGTSPGSGPTSPDGTPATITDITTFLIVPGDVLTYSLSTTLRAQGNNLAATLTAALPTGTPATPPSAGRRDVETVVTTAAARSRRPITEANDGDEIDVVVTLTFDEDSVNATQLHEVDLSGLS